jgi:hypothetical protein
VRVGGPLTYLTPGQEGQERENEKQDSNDDRQAVQYHFDATPRAKRATISTTATQKTAKVLAL